MKKEKQQQTSQKQKGTQTTSRSNCRSIKLTTQEKNGPTIRKAQSSKIEPEEIENMNRPITSTEIEAII